MKQIVYISLSLALLTSFQTNTEQNKPNEHVADQKDTIGEHEQDDRSIYIKDSSDYSIHFIKEMKRLGMHHISLVDSFMIVKQIDTLKFPQTPKIGTETTLTARKDDLAVALHITRVNQTTITYKIEMVEFGKASYNYEGEADLNPHFYLGAETDENSQTGISYLSTQFSDSQDSCYTYIRLGTEDDSGGYLLGKIVKNCNGTIRDIGLDDFPTLIEK